MQNFNISPQELSKFKQRLNQKKCFYPECESSEIIKAHSIQEGGPLTYIADDINGQREVYYLDDEFKLDKENMAMVSKQKAFRQLHHRGITAASTFTGFCGKHDAIFKNTIEDVKFEGTSKQLFYHSYRAYAYYMHKRYEFLTMFSGMGNELEQMLNLDDSSNTVPPDEPNELLQSLNKLMEGMQEMVGGLKSTMSAFSKESEKAIIELRSKQNFLDVIVKDDSFDNMEYVLITLKDVFPIACSTVLQYIDHIAQLSPDGIVHAAEFALTIFPDQENDCTSIIFGASPENPNWKILRYKLDIMPSSDKLKFISDLILDRGNNLFLSPRIIDKMNSEEKEYLVSVRSEKLEGDIGVPPIHLNLFNPKFSD